MFCQFCGKENKKNNTFCTYCGKQIDNIAVKDCVEKSAQRKETKRFKIIAVALTVIAILIAGYFFVNSVILGTVPVNTSLEAGHAAQAKDIISAKSKNASIKPADEIDTSQIGEHILNYTIKNGLFSADKKIIYNVIDTEAPVITGTDAIVIEFGEKFIPEKYFKATDNDKNFDPEITMDPYVDTNLEGTFNTVISAEDSSGNVGTLDVNIKVIKLSTDEKVALQVVNQYLADVNGDTSHIKSMITIYKTNGGTNNVSYYVEVAYDVLYAVYADGSIKEFTEIDAGGKTVYNLLRYAISLDGKNVNGAKFLNFKR